MFTDATPGKSGDKAVLQSQSFQPGGQKCFHFYYHMYGRDIATLSVVRNRLLSSEKVISLILHAATIYFTTSTFYVLPSFQKL